MIWLHCSQFGPIGVDSSFQNIGPQSGWSSTTAPKTAPPNGWLPCSPTTPTSLWYTTPNRSQERKALLQLESGLHSTGTSS